MQEKYEYEIDTNEINIDVINEKGKEASEFMSFMVDSLRNGVSVNDKSVLAAIEKHIQHMQKDMNIDSEGFASQTRFLMTDDFHRQMLEGQQTDLSYYICFTAKNYAKQ